MKSPIKPRAQFKIRIVKMRNGQNIIADCCVESGFIIMKRPMLILNIPVFNKEGEIEESSIVLVEWIESSIDEICMIPITSTFFVTSPRKYIVKIYMDHVQDENGLGKKEQDLMDYMDMYFDGVPNGVTGSSGDDDDGGNDSGYRSSQQNDPRLDT